LGSLTLRFAITTVIFAQRKLC